MAQLDVNLPPQNIEAEAAVLGSMLIERGAVEKYRFDKIGFGVVTLVSEYS